MQLNKDSLTPSDIAKQEEARSNYTMRNKNLTFLFVALFCLLLNCNNTKVKENELLKKTETEEFFSLVNPINKPEEPLYKTLYNGYTVSLNSNSSYQELIFTSGNIKVIKRLKFYYENPEIVFHLYKSNFDNIIILIEGRDYYSSNLGLYYIGNKSNKIIEIDDTLTYRQDDPETKGFKLPKAKLIKHEDNLKCNFYLGGKFLYEKNYDVASKIETEKNGLQVKINNQDIEINNNETIFIYKDLIVEAMSVSTSLFQEKESEFSLVYEKNASSTKIKDRYKFQFINNQLYLIYKETVKFNSDGIAINKLYFNNYTMKNKTYEELDLLEERTMFRFGKSTTIYFISPKNIVFGEMLIKSSSEDYFVSYPKVSNSDLLIKNAEEANNTAYYLNQIGANNESIFLLQKIIKDNPNRVVSYLNIADAYWDTNNKSEAKKNYQKYISLMKSQKKDLSKIPPRVYERIK